MGLFSFLVRRPAIIEDPVFGLLKLEWMDKKTKTAFFLSKSLVFAPTGRTISLFVDADSSGPVAEQRVFFQQIETTYPTLIQKLAPILEATFNAWKPGFRIAHFEQEFWVVSITIPRLDSRPLEWNWSFETVHDGNHLLTIYMHGFTPQPNVQVDG